MCFFLFALQILSERREELSEMLSKMYIGLHAKYPLFFSDLNESGICSTDFRVNTHI